MTLTFADILTRSDSPVAGSLLLVLSWIALSDGEVAAAEMERLRTIALSGKREADLRDIVETARGGRVEDMQLACEVLRMLEPRERRLMLQMTIGMALEDGYLTSAEGHIVRFIADVLSHSPSDLDDLFREMTGEAFPLPADPSSLDWWEAREAGASKRRQGHASNDADSAQARQGPSTPDMQRLRDLGVLGLDEQATSGQVREAYRRLVQVHHPDKFVTLGPEAVKAAEITFQRIRAAYERLMSQ